MHFVDKKLFYTDLVTVVTVLEILIILLRRQMNQSPSVTIWFNFGISICNSSPLHD